MAVPTVTATAVTTAGSTASADPSVLLPATVNPGEILVALIRKDNEAVMTWPNGWTKIVGDATDGADDQTSCAWKVADGTEDGTSITISTGVSGKYAALSYSIAGANSIAVSTLATGASNAPNPPNFNFPGGTQDYLLLWMGGWEGEQTSPPATSLGGSWTNQIGSNSGTAGAVATNCRVASARLSLPASSSFDPPSWTISASDDWTAFSVALWNAPTLLVNFRNPYVVQNAPTRAANY